MLTMTTTTSRRTRVRDGAAGGRVRPGERPTQPAREGVI